MLFSFLRKIRQLSYAPLVLAAIILASSMVTVFTPLSANAAVDFKNLSLNEKAKVFAYAKYIQRCYEGDKKVENNRDRVMNGQLFYDAELFRDADIYIFVANKSVQNEVKDLGDNDHEVTCGANDGDITKAALRSLGISGLDLVCEMGYKRAKADQGASCKGSTDQDFKSWGGIDGRDNRVSKYKNAILNVPISTMSRSVTVLG